MFSAPVLVKHHAKYPHAYYSTDVDDPAARAGQALRRAEYDLWSSLLPDDEADFDVAVYNLRRLTGKGERQIESYINSIRRLRELPVLRELQEVTAWLDLTRLAAVDAALSKTADDKLIAIIDEKLAVYLMPTKPNQFVPTAGQIRRRIYDWLRLLAPTLDVDATPKDPDPPGFSAHHGDDGRSYLGFDASTDVALQVEAAVRARAQEAGCSEGEALRDLVTGAATTRIVLNVYRAHDVEGAPAFVFGAGWLSPEVSDALQGAATQVRDMDDIAGKVSSAYQTPDDIRAYVVGRDGTCRAPGDGRSAAGAQMDHSVDFADGGPTCADNLASLCATHHNMKTDGRMYPVRLPEGEIVWLFEDGTWVHTEPEGPLSRKAKNWVQTVGQRVRNRREHLRAPEKEKVPTDPADAPPF